MHAAIVGNPHKEVADQEEFIKELMKQRRWFRPEPEAPVKTDFEALAALKDSLKNESKLIKAR